MADRPKFHPDFIAAPLQEQLAAIVQEEAFARDELPKLARSQRGRPPKKLWKEIQPRLDGFKSLLHTINVLQGMEERGLLPPHLLQALKGPGAQR